MSEVSSQEEITPEDSVSRAGSGLSRASSRSSVRMRAMAKTAAIATELALVQEQQELELEEVRLRQRKMKLALTTKLKIAEAEEKVYSDYVSEVKSHSRASQAKSAHKSSARGQLDDTIPYPTARGQLDDTVPYPAAQGTPSRPNQPHLQSNQEGQKLLETITLFSAEVMKFDGNPLHYHEFVMAFDNLIGGTSLDSSIKLMKLFQSCESDAKAIVQSCMVMEPVLGYERARWLLSERFGNSYKIGEAWISKVTTGPSYHANDKKGLRKFADELMICTETLRALDLTQEMCSQRELVRIIERLPYFLRTRWLNYAKMIRLQRRSPNISDIVQFVSEAAEEANDPVYGDLTKTQTTKSEGARPTSSKQRSKGSYATVVSDKPKPKKCKKCGKDHSLFNCNAFKAMTPELRFKFAQDNRLCYNCLQQGHMTRSCRSDKRCTVAGCTRKHTKFLHVPSQPHAEGKQVSSTDREECAANTSEAQTAQNGFVERSSCGSVTGAGRCVLPIVPVRVHAEGKKTFVDTFALLDPGSTSTFCTDTLARQVQATGRKQKLCLTTLEKSNSLVDTSVVSLVVDTGVGSHRVELPSVYTRQSIHIQEIHIAKVDDVKGWDHLKGIDVPFVTQHDVGLLIGQNAPEALIPIEVKQGQEGPYAVRTKLGWSVNGPVGFRESDAQHQVTASFIQGDIGLEEQVKRFWKIEGSDSLQKEKGMSVNDKRALAVWNDTIRQTEDHYELSVPFKLGLPELPNNYQIAEKRLQSLGRRLQRDECLHSKYSEGITALLDQGYAEAVPEKDKTEGPVWYLPHHPVFNPMKPDKTRIVFDCASRYAGRSLNDAVMQGPDLANKLVGVLLRFRQEPVAMMADIQSMFHQVRVPTKERDFLRFLWWPDGNYNNKPKEYRMCVHLFGGTWSPSYCNYALRRTAEDNKAEFSPEAVKAVTRNFYVDDCLISTKNEEDAIRLAQELKSLLEKGGFNLTKWTSNNRKVVEAIPVEDRGKQVKDLDLSNDAMPVERALGVTWDTDLDCFAYQLVPKDKPLTRRGLLSVVSSIYDPYGYASPYVLHAKIILQELTAMKLGWDDPIPEKQLQKWHKWKTSLPLMKTIRVNRCVRPPGFGEVIEYRLHHFADASEKAYGVVSYLRIKNTEGQVHCSILFARSRLAPLKRVTIPRLELMAATLSVIVDGMIRRELDLPFQDSVFWTDSSTVLHYVKSEDKRFHTFVANRVVTIHEGSEPRQWRYVNTDVNPADDVSRGLTAEELTGRWIEGPNFLWSEECNWPRCLTMNESSLENDPEVKQDNTGVFAAVNSEVKVTDRLLESYSSWFQLKKAVAWILRVKECLRRRAQKDMPMLDMNQPVSVGEMTVAEEAILQYIQRQSFEEEYSQLKVCAEDEKPRTGVRKGSPLVKLDPKMTSRGLICVGGRLKNSSVLERVKHPVILPKKHHVVKLIVRHYHELSAHSGREHVFSLLREHYWVIGGRALVREVLQKCFICRRISSPPVEQKMADLPSDRLTPDKPPFTNVGVDCFGPFKVKQRRSEVKRYGCVFTCLVLRAVHLEVLHSLETDSFINGLERFIARRGRPEVIRSDNGTNFTGANRELRAGIKTWNQKKIHEYLLQRQIDWKFNPPSASHMGGSWERQIRTTRKLLNALLKQQTLHDEGLSTFLCLVESIINGRPLTVSSTDTTDPEPLTPNHLLLLRPNHMMPLGVFEEGDLYSCKRWKQVQYLADIFWRRWLKEYLPMLNQRQKWYKETRNIEVDDIVLIVDDMPRNKWLMGRVVETYPGKDKLVRSAKVKLGTGKLTRPVQKLCLLEEAESVKQ